VPDAEVIKVSAGIQAGISLTAWAVFVLYAGPVASVFPILQDRYVKRVEKQYDQLRVARGLLHRLNYALRELFKRVEAHNAATVAASAPSIKVIDGIPLEVPPASQTDRISEIT
jgi:hypothetical protein